jgi:hypothetical protein
LIGFENASLLGKEELRTLSDTCYGKMGGMMGERSKYVMSYLALTLGMRSDLYTMKIIKCRKTWI